MSRLAWAATAPLRLATGVRRLGASRWPRLPARSVRVGNLALGGRAKTPLVAALAPLLPGHVGVLARGYPVVSRAEPPRILRRVTAHEAPWLALLSLDGREPVAAWQLAPLVGDEAPWLAAVTGLPVAVHPDRLRSAEALMGSADIDLLLLDDGLQSAVHADVDVVLVDPSRDLTGRAALREGLSAHGDALIVPVDGGGGPGGLRKVAGEIRSLATGAVVPAPEEALRLAAAVGDPDSARALAVSVGLRIGSQLRLRDHHGPRRVPPGPPLLVTAKDAVGWARARAGDAYVLGMRLDGVGALASAVASRLAAS